MKRLRLVSWNIFWQDYAGPIVAIATLAVASWTAYRTFGSFDDLRITLSVPPVIVRVAGWQEGIGKQVGIGIPDSITFINSGNRSVAMLGTKLMYQFIRVSDDIELTCDPKLSKFVSISEDAFVLLPGQIVIKHPSFPTNDKHRSQLFTVKLESFDLRLT